MFVWIVREHRPKFASYWDYVLISHEKPIMDRALNQWSFPHSDRALVCYNAWKEAGGEEMDSDMPAVYSVTINATRVESNERI